MNCTFAELLSSKTEEKFQNINNDQSKFFRFGNIEMAKNVTETAKKITEQMLEHFNLDHEIEEFDEETDTQTP